VIGATLSLTGSLGGPGLPLEAGYQQEVADVNAAGGITVGGSREKVKLVVLDNGGDPVKASSQARELVLRDHAVALLGSASPLTVMPTALVAERLRVPFLTSQVPVEEFASGDKAGWNYSWDISYDERQQAADAARALASVPGDKKVALFTDDEQGSVAERPLYAAAFKADGLDVVGDCTFPVGTTGFSSFIADAAPTLGKRYAGDPGYATAAVAYAVAEVLTDALAKAGAPVPGQVNTAIARTAARTTAGLIKFSQGAHTATTPYYVTQWQGGKLVQVQPPSPGVTFGVPTAGLG
jgi:branched-chain amino acid transport system substrate-binding protein